MVSTLAADDLFLLGLTYRIVVIPHELYLSVVGITARQAKEDAIRRERRNFLELLGEQHRGFVGFAAEQLGVTELADLLRSHVRKFSITIAQSRAPQPGHAFDVLPALVVPEIDALGALMNGRPGRGMLFQVRRRMQQVSQIPRLDRIGRKLVMQRMH